VLSFSLIHVEGVVVSDTFSYAYIYSQRFIIISTKGAHRK